MNVKDETIERPELRTVIDCVTFETVKIVEPAKYLRADKVYLFHRAEEKPYADFLEKVEEEFTELGIEHETVPSQINNFQIMLKELLELIQEEKSKDNLVYVNVSAGSRVFCAAGLVATMMEGGRAYHVAAEEYTVDEEKIEDVYCEDGELVGQAKEVSQPREIISFDLPKPNDRLIQGLKVLKDLKERGALTNTKNLVEKLEEEEGLMDDIYEKDRKKVSQSAVMRYRRQFLEKWIDKGYLKKEDRGDYEFTEDGKRMVEVFG